MPSGATYAIAVREAVGPELGAAATRLRRPTATSSGSATRSAPRRPPGAAEPVAAILSDGPESGAYYEHERLGRELSMPVVTPSHLAPARGRLYVQIGRDRLHLDVIYRRLDEDRFTDAGGSLTPLGELLVAGARVRRLRWSTRSAPGSPAASSPTPTSRT